MNIILQHHNNQLQTNHHFKNIRGYSNSFREDEQTRGIPLSKYVIINLNQK